MHFDVSIETGMCSQCKQLIVSEVYYFCHVSWPTIMLNYAPSYIWRRVTNYPFWCGLFLRLVVSSWHLDGRTTNYCLPLQARSESDICSVGRRSAEVTKANPNRNTSGISLRVVSSLTCIRVDLVFNLGRRTVCGMWRRPVLLWVSSWKCENSGLSHISSRHVPSIRF